MLEVKDLTIQYGDSIPQVKKLQLTLKKGKILSIVGESGSGKTTVIRSIVGALPTGGKIISGSIEFQGKSLLENDKHQWSQIRGSKISMIFQDCGSSLNPIRKIGTQYIEYITSHKKMKKKEAWILGCQMLGRMNLSNPNQIMKSYPHELSGGMKQRVGIAMAMTFEPDLLLADEPTSALDVTTQVQIVKEMMELTKEFGTSIIMVTHNLALAAYMSDDIIVMRHGEIVEQGEAAKVITAPNHSYTKELVACLPEMGGERLV